jgi:transposase
LPNSGVTGAHPLIRPLPQSPDLTDISERQLRRWRDEFRLLGDDAFPGQGRSRDEEITRLKRELAKAKQERDFLKEAAVFFAKESK